MAMATRKNMNRRRFVQTTLMAAAATAIAPRIAAVNFQTSAPMKRVFGKTGFQVTTLGLGGQASLQWTPEDVDPVAIILKAFDKGINYFDTSNLYGPSQTNYGKAFRKLNLVPGEAGYNEALRKSIFLTSKTHLRLAKGSDDTPGVSSRTDGAPGSHTIDDLNRSLSQMFGDGKGNFPDGAYLDLMLIHNLNTKAEVDVLYEGLENTDPNAERIGALAALRDYRDGTNLTGLNPDNKKLIKHIGFSGHYDPSVNMYMIQKDATNILDAMLVAINANDKLMFNMQNNVIPLATAKNMGVIGMKVFADGAMYTKPAEWSNKKEHVVRTVGDQNLPSKPLIQYTLTTPGVHLVIIGIGQISDNFAECQLCNNLQDAQILPDGLDESERVAIEKMAGKIKNGKTNYFQKNSVSLLPPGDLKLEQKILNNSRNILLAWNTAYAADTPLKSYEVWRDGKKIGELPFSPQISCDNLTWTESLNDKQNHSYMIRVVDKAGRTAETQSVVTQIA
jgi:aryl-alcohol dehydrogenase-like predicted oxidoreductase